MNTDPQRPPEAIVAALLDYLHDEYGVDRLQRTSMSLFSSGLLDSFALVALIAMVEERFSIVIPAEDIGEDLDSIDALSRYIASRLA